MYNNNGAKLPEGYLKNGYYKIIGGEKVLNPAYIIQYPQNIVRSLTNEGRNINKRSQIRKFYEYTLIIKDVADRKGGNFQLIEAEFYRLKPFVDYAFSRGTVSQLFKQFISENINAIKNYEDMLAFIKHFEAIVAYLPREN